MLEPAIKLTMNMLNQVFIALDENLKTRIKRVFVRSYRAVFGTVVSHLADHISMS